MFDPNYTDSRLRPPQQQQAPPRQPTSTTSPLFHAPFGAVQPKQVLSADQYTQLTTPQKNAYDQQFMSPDQINRVNQTLANQAVKNGTSYSSPYGATPQETAAGAQQATPTTQPRPAPQGGSGSPVNANGTVTPGPSPSSLPQAPMPTLAAPAAMPPRPTNTNLGAPVATPAGYAGSTFAQFMAPNSGTVAPQSQALMQAILAHPLTMSDQVVGALQAQQRDQAVEMANQAKAALMQNAVGRGLTPAASGFVGANKAAIDQHLIDSILSGNRQIAIQKATQDRQDQLAALDAANTFLNSQLARAGQSYGLTLSGQQAQAAADQAAANSRLQGAQFDMAQQLARAQNAQQNYTTDLGAYNATRQNNLQDFLAQLQAYMGQQGLNLDTAKLAETARQFNDQLGLGYDQLNQQGQNSLLDFLWHTYYGN